ncbi:unnamed protein product [Linum trigynum]|uniref:Uncharacterized protein n=1 Tax=Linum trigynum TaxID=586398 RepID=A0AAV2DCC2_9ROSI
MENEGYVKGKNMFSRVYSQRIREKTQEEPEVVMEPDTVVEPEVESEAVVEVDVDASVVKPSDEVEVESVVATEVEPESIVELEVEVPVVKSSTEVEVPVVDPEVQHTESIFGQVNVMLIALQTAAAAEESIETPPSTIPSEDIATVFDPSTEVLTQGEAAPSEGELIAAACQRMLEDSDDDILVSERPMTQEEAEFMHSITPEAWKATLKTLAFERSKHHPIDSSVYVLAKSFLTKRHSKWLSSSLVPHLKMITTLSWKLQRESLAVAKYCH